MNITNLFKNNEVSNEEYKPTIYYHGINYPFTFCCGYCHMTITENDKICSHCNKKINWTNNERQV